MLEDLKLLIRLQDIDNELLELEAEKGDLPEQIQSLKQELDRFTQEVLEARREIEESHKQSLISKRDQDSARERLKKSQSLIYSVKTTREYDALTSEIDQAKSQISDTERLLLNFQAREEELQLIITDRQNKLKDAKAEFEDRHKDMSERLESSREDELQLNHEREKIVVRLKKPVYAHYERIKKIRDGVGVSRLTDNACGYCFSHIPPQRQIEIKRMDDLLLCEVCGCIVVYDEEQTTRG